MSHGPLAKQINSGPSEIRPRPINLNSEKTSSEGGASIYRCCFCLQVDDGDEKKLTGPLNLF